MLTSMRPAGLAALVVLLVACSASSAGGSPVPTPPSTSPPSAGPTASPADFGAIEHATGATDVILRYERGGGFMMPGFLAVQAPIFTLYGDGRIVFRNPDTEMLPADGAIMPFAPFRTARLSEDQIQATLAFAIGQGGLGTARPKYENNFVSDAPTTVFTLDAGGLKKSVSIYALGMDAQGQPDAAAFATFERLAERLANFDENGTIPTDEYVPAAYRGVLLDGGLGDSAAIKWPWDDLKPGDFVSQGDPNAFPVPVHVLTVGQVEALGVEPYTGGFLGATLIGPDKKAYSFALRPLLPDETE